MQFLYFLEGIRTPALDLFASLITHLGEETIFMILALVIFWCVDKYEGYYLLTMGFIGTTINQILKIMFRIPRPWVLDKNFTIVEAAREQATGYSFPSGHSQIGVTVYGGLARWNRRTWIRITGILLCILIPFSRMYLGVHTPKDVLTSVFIGLVLVLVTYPLIQASKKDSRIMWGYLILLLIITVLGLIYVYNFSFPVDVDVENLASARENLCKLLGAMLGFLVAFFMDSRYTKFETRASLRGQIIKLVVGILIVLAVQQGLKSLFLLVLYERPIGDVLRYFLLVVAAGGLWPMSFKFFNSK